MRDIKFENSGQTTGVTWAIIILVIVSIVISGIALMTNRSISSSNDEIKDTLDEINQKIGPGPGEQEEEEEEKTIKIGWLGAVETDQGLASWRVVQIFAEHYNEIWRHEDEYPNWKVELVGPYDTAESTTEGVQSYNTLIGKNPDIIIESAVDDVTLAMMDRVKESEIPHVTVFTSAVRALDRVLEDDIYNFFMTEDYDYYHAYYLGEWVDTVSRQFVNQGYPEPGLQTTVAMIEDTAYGRGTLEMAEEVLPGRGYEIIDTVIVDPGTDDYAPIYDSIVAKDPDFITVVQSVRDLPPVKQWVDLEVGIPMIGINVSGMGPYFWEDAAGDAWGAPARVVSTPYSEETSSELGQMVYESYIDHWGTSRPLWQFTSFQSYTPLLMAFKAAGQTGDFWDSEARESCRNWVEAMEEVELVTYQDGEVFNRFSFYPIGEEAPETDYHASHNWIVGEKDGKKYYDPQCGVWLPEGVGAVEMPLGGSINVYYPERQATGEGFPWLEDVFGPIEEQ